jgi:hypothetical protein
MQQKYLLSTERKFNNNKHIVLRGLLIMSLECNTQRQKQKWSAELTGHMCSVISDKYNTETYVVKINISSNTIF